MKVNINKIMDEIVSLQNQITGLQMLLDQKKGLMAKYFDKTGNRSVSNDDCTVFVQERTTINYDVEKIRNRLSKDKCEKFIESERYIDSENWFAFVKLMKKYKVPSLEVFQSMKTRRVVDQKKLSRMYENGEINLKELDGCFDAKVKKSVVLKMKDVNKEIPLKG